MIPMASSDRRRVGRNRRAGPTSAAKDGFGPAIGSIHTLAGLTSASSGGE